MKSFVINHQRYDESTVFTITAPELGTLIAPVETVQELATVGAVGLRLGPVTTPLPCRSQHHPQHNAYLHFYALQDYIRLQVVYTCSCPYDYHNHSLEWEVLFNKAMIVATKIGSYYRQPHNHPMAMGFEELAPAPYVPEPAPIPAIPFRNLPKVAEPESVAVPVAEPQKSTPVLPNPNVSRYGQFTLF